MYSLRFRSPKKQISASTQPILNASVVQTFARKHYVFDCGWIQFPTETWKIEQRTNQFSILRFETPKLGPCLTPNLGVKSVFPVLYLFRMFFRFPVPWNPANNVEQRRKVPISARWQDDSQLFTAQATPAGDLTKMGARGIFGRGERGMFPFVVNAGDHHGHFHVFHVFDDCSTDHGQVTWH